MEMLGSRQQDAPWKWLCWVTAQHVGFSRDRVNVKMSFWLCTKLVDFSTFIVKNLLNAMGTMKLLEF